MRGRKAAQHPTTVSALRIGYDEAPLAPPGGRRRRHSSYRRVSSLAASPSFMVLRYGTIPRSSRLTGGLADTVNPGQRCRPEGRCRVPACSFNPITARCAFRRHAAPDATSLSAFTAKAMVWASLQRNAMRHPVGWASSAPHNMPHFTEDARYQLHDTKTRDHDRRPGCSSRRDFRWRRRQFRGLLASMRGSMDAVPVLRATGSREVARHRNCPSATADVWHGYVSGPRGPDSFTATAPHGSYEP